MLPMPTMKLLRKSLWWNSLLVLCLAAPTQAQVNLVPDGSFEDTSAVWQNWYGHYCLNDWFCLGGNATNNKFFLWSLYRLDQSYRLPSSYRFDQWPRHGANTIELTIWDKNNYPTPPTWIKSFPKAALQTQLIAGKEYCATAYITSGDLAIYEHINGFGMYFDNGMLDTVITIHKDSTGDYFLNTQVQCGFPITDTANWVKIQGSFIANGTETHITMGNFLEDSALIFAPAWVSPTYPAQPIMVDDVSLIPIDLHDWLQDAYVAVGDSVWVGLHPLEYSDGIWYDSTMQILDTAAGFWYTPEANNTWFIQGIEVCGTMRYDTMHVYFAPQSVQAHQQSAVLVYPNPCTTNCTIEVPQTYLGETCTLVNALGQTVLQQVLSTTTKSIKLQQLPRGLYYLHVKGEVKKLVLR
jgi:hypothetical protein